MSKTLRRFTSFPNIYIILNPDDCSDGLERKLSGLKIEFCQEYCSITAQEIHISNDKTGKKLRDVKKYKEETVRERKTYFAEWMRRRRTPFIVVRHEMRYNLAVASNGLLTTGYKCVDIVERP